jgi:hypothetical protein
MNHTVKLTPWCLSSPYEEYFTYVPSTHSYEEYVPETAEWENYFESPVEDLYSYEIATNTYEAEYEPSPFASYYYYEPATETFQAYTPISIREEEIEEEEPVREEEVPATWAVE